MNYKFKINFSEFILKIFAILAMTFYHVGLFLEQAHGPEILISIFYAIGRVAFPLFVFMIVEGVKHTKHFGKYLLRIGILATIIAVGELIVYQFDNSVNFPSPIIELLLIAITIYLLNKKNKFSLLSILPIGYILMCFVIGIVETKGDYTVVFLPSYLRADYSLFGLLLAIAFNYSKNITKYFLLSKDETKCFENTLFEQKTNNLISAISLIFITLAFYILELVGGRNLLNWQFASYSAFAALPILFYSGERGYNAKWFKYGCYLYFPLHLIIIYLVFNFIL